ncbi:molecular chaperone HscC [Sphingomonas sp. So64.6b]|uniref:Hsp70 family protein n=1 Tax=Sphingomonas sp. So64.6b TaxID=2997354 RepID=UPI0016018702|nr:molecular chaperone HscC [Sphingomonas sp. So64.6b]QNA83069.1 molecular chaperone HscC [Sphingomonas sp. So64.6b]
MIVGIDLGTTNSAIGIWRNGQAELIPNAIGDLLTPSAVAIDDSGAVIIGMAARDRQSTHPAATVTAFKRWMGTRQTVKLGGKTFNAEDLSAIMLASLKADAEAFLGEPVTSAVITVPAYFNDRQRKATRRAGELAGLTVERLINEPTAAALAYGIQSREEKEPFLVFDLGGGTFDVSIVEIFDGVIEVRASAGDNRLGGEDFNDTIIEIARPRIDPEGRLSEVDPMVLHELLRAAAERCRRGLSDEEEASFTVTSGDRQFTTNVTASEFETQAAPLLARLRDPVLRSLRDSDIRVESLSEVILVGGGTRMPVVRKTITRMFGRFPNAAVHPDHAVALGAAVQGGLKSRDADLEEIRLTDVCPFTLGVDNSASDGRGGFRHGLFSPIIERNTPIPASRVSYYSTLIDNQRNIEFGIYQGEAREVQGNVKLGAIKVPVPPARAGEVHVECRFSYDTSGLLEVDVHVPASGLVRNLVLMDDEDAPDAKEVEARRKVLAALKRHPREDSHNMAVLARAARCYESFIGERRDMVGHWTAQFETALDGQDPKIIAAARAQFEEALNQLEGDRYL